jgi:hypothetical protein
LQLTKIEGVLEKARGARNQLEADAFQLNTDEGFEVPELAFVGFLQPGDGIAPNISGLPKRSRLKRCYSA